MAFGGLRTLLGLIVLCAAAACGFRAEASPIYTYSFEQTGYTVNWTGTAMPGTLKGSFSGTVDAFDRINLGTLTAFQVQFDTTGASQSYSGLPDYFSFQTGSVGGSTTLAFQTPLPLFTGASSEACIGAAVSILCGGGTALGYVRVSLGSTLLFSSSSSFGPTVNLVSVATTPIPGALVLFATALGGFGAIRIWRRKPALA